MSFRKRSERRKWRNLQEFNYPHFHSGPCSLWKFSRAPRLESYKCRTSLAPPPSTTALSRSCGRSDSAPSSTTARSPSASRRAPRSSLPPSAPSRSFSLYEFLGKRCRHDARRQGGGPNTRPPGSSGRASVSRPLRRRSGASPSGDRPPGRRRAAVSGLRRSAVLGDRRRADARRNGSSGGLLPWRGHRCEWRRSCHSYRHRTLARLIPGGSERQLRGASRGGGAVRSAGAPRSAGWAGSDGRAAGGGAVRPTGARSPGAADGCARAIGPDVSNV